MSAADENRAAVPADSAGTPWAGRNFDSNQFADDDGAVSPSLLDAIEAFRSGGATQTAVIDAIRDARLLIPLVAHLAEAGTAPSGHAIDKSAELAIVNVQGPDGRRVLPVFSSVEAMRRWDPLARPVPADAVRVGLAAASEATDLVVLDPRSDTEFVIRRPALWALAQQADWVPSYLDDEVEEAFTTLAVGEPSVTSVDVTSGDPVARLIGPEVVVTLTIEPGLDAAALAEVLERISARFAASTVIAERVDSLGLRVTPSSDTGRG